MNTQAGRQGCVVGFGLLGSGAVYKCGASYSP